MITEPFVADDFVVPKTVEHKHFCLAVLAPAVVEIDYDAVMSSRTRLRTVFAESDDWPKDSMTLEDNLKDLQQHEHDFNTRQAFAYTVLSNSKTKSKTKCIGCVYIDPCKLKEFDCEIYLWVRDDALELDQELYEFISNWTSTDWPFSKIAYPGREIPWQTWQSLSAINTNN